ncbi:cell envelope integrity protein CreD [Roseateles violae]|uniref:Cell envelope integrity protein CreD n=1 Tax=Roseateles violae TaxID=3058042 RepID=A0ABT8DKY8_9BURK|nr:cell envelope integrity protein CreD [Pelomonas sp. PFR6]MDN3919077.1 cell envelope integrity protein CreD [Pelomonas sp. PFR6]
MGARAMFFKLLILAAVTLLLGVVLARIGWLVDERQQRQQEAVSNVEQSQAGAQTLLGPLLLRRCSEEWDTVGGEGRERQPGTEKRDFLLAAVPSSLQVGGALNQEARYRGLFKVNGYAGQLQFDAQWTSLEALRPRTQHAGSRLQCGEPQLLLASSDPRGLRTAELRRGEQRLEVRPGTLHPQYPRGLHAALPEQALDAPLQLRLTLELAGTQRFALVPAAAATRLNLRSDWPHPSFGGRFLPSAREVGEAGFSAQWRVSELASTAAADVLDQKTIAGVGGSGPNEVDTLELALIDPVNPYVMSDRAIKYGLMFILLTFVCVGLVELLSGRRVHPLQYLFVGLALSVFFLLLLSLSEQLSFGLSYLLAGAAAVLLLGHYGAAMLGGWRRGAAFGAGIALLYAALYLLLSLEQAALLIGALLLFAVLAAVMTLTRRIDWYALGATGSAPSP